jgi:hypothetical protein
MKFSIINFQLSFNFQQPMLQFANVWDLIFVSYLKTENCKLEIAFAGGKR